MRIKQNVNKLGSNWTDPYTLDFGLYGAILSDSDWYFHETSFVNESKELAHILIAAINKRYEN